MKHWFFSLPAVGLFYAAGRDINNHFRMWHWHWSSLPWIYFRLLRRQIAKHFYWREKSQVNTQLCLSLDVVSCKSRLFYELTGWRHWLGILCYLKRQAPFIHCILVRSNCCFLKVKAEPFCDQGLPSLGLPLLLHFIHTDLKFPAESNSFRNFDTNSSRIRDRTNTNWRGDRR